MPDDLIRRLAIEQRKRLVASIMNHAESAPWFAKLTTDEKKSFRSKVLDSIGSYHDFMLDVVKVTGEDMMYNEQALTMIGQVHAGQKRLERMLQES